MDSSPTWGITGSVFLTAFVSAGLLLAWLALRVRARIVMARLPEAPELHGYALVFSRQRHKWDDDAVIASLVFLRSKGLVEVEPDGTLRSAGGGEDLTDPLDRAVLQAIADGKRLGELKDHPSVESATALLSEEHRVWLGEIQREYYAWARWSMLAVLPLGLLLAVGVIRLWAEVANDEPAGALLVWLSLLSAGIVALLWRWAPEPPPTPWRKRFRARNRAIVEGRLRKLRSRSSRSGTGLSMDEALLTVLFFGYTDLSDIDPALDAVVKAEAEGGKFGSNSEGSFSSGSSYGGVYGGSPTGFCGGCGGGGDGGSGGGGGCSG